MKTHITAFAILASALIACVPGRILDTSDDGPAVSDDAPPRPQPPGDGDDDEDTETPPDIPRAEWGWEPEPDMPDDDPGECACEDPGMGDGDGDPAGPGDGDHYCGCGIIGAEDSYCYSPDGCDYFLGGCPDGWATICA
jgi:hypothetical protein